MSTAEDRAPALQLDDVRGAANAIADAVQHTPCVRSLVLSSITGAEVWLKLENLQFTASYKERGALFRLLGLSSDERTRGVVSMSAGNFAQAIAYHAARLGIPSTIVMPEATSFSKAGQTERLGARVVREGADLSAAEDAARAIAHERGALYVSPYDDDRVIAGQGTAAIEFFADAPPLDVLLVPTGGGGLLAGCAVVASALHPALDVIGVQVASHPFFADAFGVALPPDLPRGAPTIADGITARRPGVRTLALARGRVADLLLVSEEAIERAVRLFCEIEKLVVEGAGAAGLAALLEHGPRFAGRRVGLLVTGGNIDSRMLALVLLRGLAQEGRLVRLRVSLPDQPGALARLATLFGTCGANILEVVHQRTFAHVPVRSAEVEVTLETRHREHSGEVLAALAAAGLPATVIDGAPANSPSTRGETR